MKQCPNRANHRYTSQNQPPSHVTQQQRRQLCAEQFGLVANNLEAAGTQDDNYIQQQFDLFRKLLQMVLKDTSIRNTPEELQCWQALENSVVANLANFKGPHFGEFLSQHLSADKKPSSYVCQKIASHALSNFHLFSANEYYCGMMLLYSCARGFFDAAGDALLEVIMPWIPSWIHPEAQPRVFDVSDVIPALGSISVDVDDASKVRLEEIWRAQVENLWCNAGHIGTHLMHLVRMGKTPAPETVLAHCELMSKGLNWTFLPNHPLSPTAHDFVQLLSSLRNVRLAGGGLHLGPDLIKMWESRVCHGRELPPKGAGIHISGSELATVLELSCELRIAPINANYLPMLARRLADPTVLGALTGRDIGVTLSCLSELGQPPLLVELMSAIEDRALLLLGQEDGCAFAPVDAARVVWHYAWNKMWPWRLHVPLMRTLAQGSHQLPPKEACRLLWALACLVQLVPPRARALHPPVGLDLNHFIGFTRIT